MPELRIDPICGRRVYIAEDRAGRPSDFVDLPEPTRSAQQRDRQARCPFCRGHESETPTASAAVLDAEGRWQVRVVPNKYPAVRMDSSAGDALGAHEVIIESPDHRLDVVELSPARFAQVLGVYRDRLRHWSADNRLKHAIIFKNSGPAAGASLEHVHSQLIALPDVPDAAQAEFDGAARYHAAHARCVFCDLLRREIDAADRLVLRGDGYVGICAYAGRQPFETWIIPERHAARFDDVQDDDLPVVAVILQEVLRRLHAETGGSAYNLILHTGSFDGAHDGVFHWHWELIPRSTQLAGFEWGSGRHINPMSPERAARRLREAVLPPPAHPAEAGRAEPL